MMVLWYLFLIISFILTFSPDGTYYPHRLLFTIPYLAPGENPHLRLHSCARDVYDYRNLSCVRIANFL